MVGIFQLALLDDDFLLSSCYICSVTLRKFLCLERALLIEADPASRSVRFALQLLHALSRRQNLLFQHLVCRLLLEKKKKFLSVDCDIHESNCDNRLIPCLTSV